MLPFLYWYWRKNRHILMFYSFVSLFSIFATVVLISLYLVLPKAASAISGIPEEIIQDSIGSGLGDVILFGNFEARHDFGHGVATPFGTMPYDIEARLAGPPYYWSNKEIHRKGFFTGFSDLE
jgi:hypothetical protein